MSFHTGSRRSQPPLALSVPLSLFTPRVGGGSAFYVRQHYTLMKNRILGIHILAATILTAAWMLICPKFVLSGQSESTSTYKHYVSGGYHLLPHEHIDLGYFLGGLVIIWGGTMGVYYLRKKDVA